MHLSHKNKWVTPAIDLFINLLREQAAAAACTVTKKLLIKICTMGQNKYIIILFIIYAGGIDYDIYLPCCFLRPIGTIKGYHVEFRT